MKKIFLLVLLVFTNSTFFAQTKTTAIEAKSNIDWTLKQFKSAISLDIRKAGLKMPSNRNTADALIKIKMPSLMKDPILSLYADSSSYLGDLVEADYLTLDQITDIIECGKQTPSAFSENAEKLKITDTVNINEITRLLIKHKYPYTPEEPINTVSSRPYSGIVIDARGLLPVHGEYIKNEAAPCFFPRIWDEDMSLIYERNMIDIETAKTSGVVHYDYSQDSKLFEKTAGTDPLYIKAYKIFGRNRTDPVIRKRDALKIITVPENLELLKYGKVVILLEKPQLVYDIKLPEKNHTYYSEFKKIKQYFYENKVPDVTVTDSVNGILFSVNLKFIPDSSELLPEERVRIQQIAEILSDIIKRSEFTILVEGHTADVGKPSGQMHLSVERTKTVMKELISEGLPEAIFSYKGYGGTKPIAPNTTEDGRAQNRRVDITARPKATYIQKDWN